MSETTKGKLQIAVGSKNKTKVKAAEIAISKVFPNCESKIVSVEVCKTLVNSYLVV